jgi:hypothetical protein
MSKINELLQNFENKRILFWRDLQKEYDALKEKYHYKFYKKKVIFSKEVIEEDKKWKNAFIKDFFTPSSFFKHTLSIPFIYGMIIPVLLLDIFLFIYQQTAFRLYGIPFVKRSDYIIYDRRFLNYLNIVDKLHCLYCSYMNWLFSYAVEIAWRTEKYWCPIKNSMKMKWGHNWQKYFADYGDAKTFREVMNKNTEYYKELEK